jgi:hypothetical protein
LARFSRSRARRRGGAASAQPPRCRRADAYAASAGAADSRAADSSPGLRAPNSADPRIRPTTAATTAASSVRSRLRPAGQDRAQLRPARVDRVLARPGRDHPRQDHRAGMEREAPVVRRKLRRQRARRGRPADGRGRLPAATRPSLQEHAARSRADALRRTLHAPLRGRRRFRPTRECLQRLLVLARRRAGAGRPAPARASSSRPCWRDATTSACSRKT